MRWIHPVVSFVLVLFSLLFLITSIKLGIGDIGNPGPGMMGFLSAALLLCLSFIIFVKDCRAVMVEKGKGISIPAKALTKLIILFGALWVYALILDTAGFLVSTFALLFVAFYLYSPNQKQWYRALFIAFLITAATFLFFNRWLRVYLPPGIFHIGW